MNVLVLTHEESPPQKKEKQLVSHFDLKRMLKQCSRHQFLIQTVGIHQWQLQPTFLFLILLTQMRF